MINEYYRDDPRYPICYCCDEPIIEGESYIRIPVGKVDRFYHFDCLTVEEMTDGGAE